jgi:hypothetical protein
LSFGREEGDERLRRHKAFLLALALVTLSCATLGTDGERSDDDIQRDRCVGLGAIWDDINGVCIFATGTSGQKSTAQKTAETPASASKDAPGNDFSQCDARDSVTDEFLVTEESHSPGGGGFCFYRLWITNNSAEPVFIYIYDNRNDYRKNVQSGWEYIYAPAGKTVWFPGGATYWNETQWHYDYLERAAAVYHTEYCQSMAKIRSSFFMMPIRWGNCSHLILIKACAMSTKIGKTRWDRWPHQRYRTLCTDVHWDFMTMATVPVETNRRKLFGL